MELSSPIKYTGITWYLRVLTRILWFKVLCKCFIDFAPVMNMWQFMFHASCHKPPNIIISQEWNKHRSEKSTSSNSFELLVVELATPCMNYQGYKQNLIISKCLRMVWRHETASFIRTLFQLESIRHVFMLLIPPFIPLPGCADTKTRDLDMERRDSYTC